MNEELERIVHNTEESIEFSALTSEESQVWIRTRLQSFRIYSAGSDNDQNMPVAIRVFECEYIDCVPERLTGRLDSVVVQAMNSAFNENWRRELSFHYRVGNENIYFPYDMDNQRAFGQLSGNEIFALEGNQQGINLPGFSLGTVVHFSGFFGTQRFATEPFYYRLFSTSMERVIFAIARNEGGNPVNANRRVGGYDTSNSYDRVFLSVGLFHWNRDWLWRLMDDYRENSRNLYDQFSQRLGIDAVWRERNRHFVVNGNFYRMDNLGVLRRLKYVYLFLREAERSEFQAAQRRTASLWVNMALDRRLDQSSPQFRAYINSEFAVALYVDMTVIRGETGGGNIAREAIRNVLTQITDVTLRNNPANWTAVQEEMVINAIKTHYERIEPGRVSLIESITPALSRERGAF